MHRPEIKGSAFQNRSSLASVFALSLILIATSALADDAANWRYDAARTGSTSEPIAPDGSAAGATLVWESTVPSGVLYSSVCVGGGRLYVGSPDNILYCLDASDGSTIWTYPTEYLIQATPVYYKGRLYVASRDGNIHILNAVTGQQAMAPIFHGGDTISSPVIDNDVIYFCPGDPSKEVRAYNALTGAYLWAFAMNQTSWSSPAVANGKVYVGNNAGRWYCLDATTGAKLWEYTTLGIVQYSSPAVMGNTVIFCSGGIDPSAGPYNQRGLHMVDATTGALIKTVLVQPPAGAVPKNNQPFLAQGGGATEDHPGAMLDEKELFDYLQMAKEDRDEMLDQRGAAEGRDFTPLKDYLDSITDPATSKIQKNGTFNLGYSAYSSSPAFSNGKAVITHREMGGNGTDDFFTVCIDTASGAAQDVLWGTLLSTQTLMNGLVVPSPTIANDTYCYNAHGTLLQIRQMSDGTKVGEVDYGDLILGSPIIANGRIYVCGVSGKVSAYATNNSPPMNPTTYSPTGGTNITTTDTPTLTWTGQFDAETPTANLVPQLRIGIGAANEDVEMLDTVTTLAAGAGSHQITTPIAYNTPVYWSIRFQDGNGAYSAWSPVQNFWVKYDATVPDPAENLIVISADQSLFADWDASPSSDVTHYNLWHKPSADAWTVATLVDTITGTSYTVPGLTNGSSYDIMVVAVDQASNESSAITVTGVQPQPSVQIEGGGSFSTIPLALTTATSGDVVVVGAGVYTGDLTVPAGVSLRGASPTHTTIRGSGNGTVLTVQGTYGTDARSTISQLRIENGAIGINAGTADVLVQNVILHSLADDAIQASSGGRLHAINNTIMSNAGDGLDSLAETLARNNIIAKNSGTGVNAPTASDVDYNQVYGNTVADLATGLLGIGNESDEPLFTDETGNDYTILEDSPTIDTGDPTDGYDNEPSPNGGRINKGAYGNTVYAAESGLPPTPIDEIKCGSIALDLLLPLLLFWFLRRRFRYNSAR